MSAVHIVAASLGGVAQFVGAFLVLREPARLRRSELGQIGAFGRLWDGVKQTGARGWFSARAGDAYFCGRCLRKRIDSVTTYYEKQIGELREKRGSDIARAITRASRNPRLPRRRHVQSRCQPNHVMPRTLRLALAFAPLSRGPVVKSLA